MEDRNLEDRVLDVTSKLFNDRNNDDDIIYIYSINQELCVAAKRNSLLYGEPMPYQLRSNACEIKGCDFVTLICALDKVIRVFCAQGEEIIEQNVTDRVSLSTAKQNNVYQVLFSDSRGLKYRMSQFTHLKAFIKYTKDAMLTSICCDQEVETSFRKFYDLMYANSKQEEIYFMLKQWASHKMSNVLNKVSQTVCLNFATQEKFKRTCVNHGNTIAILLELYLTTNRD